MSDIHAELRDFVSLQISDMVGHAADLSKDFFGTGGDSFDAVVLASAIEEKYGFAVNVADVIDAYSIAGLCEQLAGESSSRRAELG